MDTKIQMLRSIYANYDQSQRSNKSDENKKSDEFRETAEESNETDKHVLLRRIYSNYKIPETEDKSGETFIVESSIPKTSNAEMLGDIYKNDRILTSSSKTSGTINTHEQPSDTNEMTNEEMVKNLYKNKGQLIHL